VVLAGISKTDGTVSVHFVCGAEALVRLKGITAGVKARRAQVVFIDSRIEKGVLGMGLYDRNLHLNFLDADVSKLQHLVIFMVEKSQLDSHRGLVEQIEQEYNTVRSQQARQDDSMILESSSSQLPNARLELKKIFFVIPDNIDSDVRMELMKNLTIAFNLPYVFLIAPNICNFSEFSMSQLALRQCSPARALNSALRFMIQIDEYLWREPLSIIQNNETLFQQCKDEMDDKQFRRDFSDSLLGFKKLIASNDSIKVGEVAQLQLFVTQLAEIIGKIKLDPGTISEEDIQALNHIKQQLESAIPTLQALLAGSIRNPLAVFKDCFTRWPATYCLLPPRGCAIQSVVLFRGEALKLLSFCDEKTLYAQKKLPRNYGTTKTQRNTKRGANTTESQRKKTTRPSDYLDYFKGRQQELAKRFRDEGFVQLQLFQHACTFLPKQTRTGSIPLTKKNHRSRIADTNFCLVTFIIEPLIPKMTDEQVAAITSSYSAIESIITTQPDFKQCLELHEDEEDAPDGYDLINNDYMEMSLCRSILDQDGDFDDSLQLVDTVRAWSLEEENRGLLEEICQDNSITSTDPSQWSDTPYDPSFAIAAASFLGRRLVLALRGFGGAIQVLKIGWHLERPAIRLACIGGFKWVRIHPAKGKEIMDSDSDIETYTDTDE